MRKVIWFGLLVWVASVRAEVGPDILVSLGDGDATVMRHIWHSVQPAANQNNRVAQRIVHEARVALGHDAGRDKFRVDHRRDVQFDEASEALWASAAEKRAQDGDPFFMNVKALLLGWGHGVPLDHTEGLEWLRKGAEAGGPMAMTRLALCYINGTLPRDLLAAKELYSKAGERDIPLALYSLGSLYRGQYSEIPIDTQKSYHYWEKASQMGHADSQYALGMLCMTGADTLPVNVKQGEIWLRKAATAGHPQARNFVNDFFDNPPPRRNLPQDIPINGVKIPSMYVAYEDLPSHLASGRIAVVCFVDTYNPRHNNQRLPHGSNPSGMLDIFLWDLRKIGTDGNEIDVDLAGVNIFIVESYEMTRAWIRTFDRQRGYNIADDSTPAVFVWDTTQEKPVMGFTYSSSAPEASSFSAKRNLLRQTVLDLLTE